jgi:hypothetical protein
MKLMENKNFDRAVFRFLPKDGIKLTIKSILIKSGLLHR